MRSHFQGHLPAVRTPPVAGPKRMVGMFSAKDSLLLPKTKSLHQKLAEAKKCIVQKRGTVR
jgi:hypothetical protein